MRKLKPISRLDNVSQRVKIIEVYNSVLTEGLKGREKRNNKI